MKLRNIFAVALAGLALTACNKDDAPDQGTNNAEATTYVGLTIQLPKGTGTKAADATNAIAAETKLTSLTVYCWKDGALGMGSPTIVDLTSSGNYTDNGDNNYTVNAAIKANVGKNNLFVIANANPSLTLADVTTPNAIEQTVAILAEGSDGFIMYADKVTVLDGVVQADKATVEAGGVSTNNVTVNLRRAVAKVVLTSDLGDYASGVADADGNGKLYDIKWNIVHQPKALFPVVKMTSNTSNWATDFVVTNITSPYDAFDANSTTLADVPTASGTPSTPQYCKENAHGADVYKENNTTAVQVEAVFVPGANKYITGVVDGGASYTLTKGGNDMTQGDIFYVLKTDDKNLVAGNFFDQTGANAYVAIKGGAIADYFNTYTDGKCYWAIWINDGNSAAPKYGVLRNHLYKMNLRSIAAPGYPSFPNEDTPIAADTWIQVTVDVEAWSSKDMGDIELK